jgi:glycosyltransferase involved in cell wall biosynthesis
MTLPRILMLSDRYLPVIGGAELQAHALSLGLMQRGHTVKMLTRRLKAEHLQYEEIDGFPVRRLAPVGLSHLANLLMVFRMLIYLLLHASEYDVLHVHCLGPLGLAAIVAGKLARKPVVLKVASAGDISRKPMGGEQISIYSRVVRRFILPSWLWFAFLRQANCIVALSNDIRHEAQEAGLDSITRFIPNGVNTKRFAPVSAQHKATLKQQLGFTEQPLLVASGRLVALKRFDVLLKAFALVLKSHPRCQLALAGSGDMQKNNVEGELRALTAELGITDQVVFMGMIEDIPRLFNAADVFVLTSEREGMPNTVLEAMASGLPVVCTEIGGVLEIVDVQSAVLVPVGDWNTLAIKLIELLNQPDKRLKMGTYGLMRIEKQFSLDAVTQIYNDLYIELTSE